MATAVQAAPAPHLKSQLALPDGGTPAASAPLATASQPASTAGLHGALPADSVKLRDVLAAPAPPQPPPALRAPSLPAVPQLGLRSPQDNAVLCRQTCATARYQCLVEETGACDSAWSTCVINCNLPLSRTSQVN